MTDDDPPDTQTVNDGSLPGETDIHGLFSDLLTAGLVTAIVADVLGYVIGQS